MFLQGYKVTLYPGDASELLPTALAWGLTRQVGIERRVRLDGSDLLVRRNKPSHQATARRALRLLR
ncbi:MAG: hypothetical protein QOH91_2555 [Mycobacterium sp.]|nr:hypothetical protein [Mycobacterium sp.]